MPEPIAELYLEAQRSFVELARRLTEPEWATPVPCCPGWTVRDVLSHVAGIPDDAMHGRRDGVATPEWTASQVERNRHLTVAELIERWDAQAPLFADAIETMGERRPPIDCHTHEHDVRQAIGRPGDRVSGLLATIAGWLRADLELVPAGLDDFELFRARLGRRSRAQVLAYGWPAPPTAAQLDAFFVFGPSPHDIAE
jgi:uncharacterized protein (TIGR03083 family)